MNKFLVVGGLSGHHDDATDATVLTEKFEERFATEDEAVARAREIAKSLRPGGSVMVEESVTNADNPMNNARFIGLVCRLPHNGRFWMNSQGVNLIPPAGEFTSPDVS